MPPPMLTETSYGPVIVRQEHLQKLEPLCRGLGEALCQGGLDQPRTAEAFRVAVSAECVTCGIRVSGQELFALSRPPSPELSGIKTGRLRRGYCAREGCDSFYYRLSFQPYCQIDWAKILSGVASSPSEKCALQSSRGARKAIAWPRIHLQVPRAAWLVVGGIVALWLLHQWYIGGRIPLVREPEKFHVDPAPLEEFHEVQAQE